MDKSSGECSVRYLGSDVRHSSPRVSARGISSAVGCSRGPFVGDGLTGFFIHGRRGEGAQSKITLISLTLWTPRKGTTLGCRSFRMIPISFSADCQHRKHKENKHPSGACGRKDATQVSEEAKVEGDVGRESPGTLQQQNRGPEKKLLAVGFIWLLLKRFEICIFGTILFCVESLEGDDQHRGNSTHTRCCCCCSARHLCSCDSPPLVMARSVLQLFFGVNPLDMCSNLWAAPWPKELNRTKASRVKGGIFIDENMARQV